MSIAVRLLETLFENRYDFVAPDSGPHKVPYTCSFHWFHTSDGRLIGLDLVRSDDMGRRALRVFAISSEGDLGSLILEGPSSEWAPFATDARPTLSQEKPFLAGARTGSQHPLQLRVNRLTVFHSNWNSGSWFLEKERARLACCWHI